LFRADVGIDDSCRRGGGLQFEVYGDGRLLYASGVVNAPTVVKPELDIRGIRELSLRTSASSATACGNWANAALTGFDGDTVQAAVKAVAVGSK
jgi:hypothetical protein